LRCETLATYSYLLAHEERWAEALECNAAAFALAEESGNAHTMFRCRLYRGFTLLNSDERTGAALISDCIEIGRQHGYDAEVAHAMSSLGFHWTDTNQLDRADRALAGAAEFAVAHELDCWQRWARLGMSRSALARGDWQHAADLAGSVIQVRNGCFSNRFYGYLTIARIRARRGDPEVELALEAAAASCPEEPTPWLAAQLAAARTEATFLAGDHDRALQIARQALPSAARYGYRWIAGELGHYLIAAGGTLPCKIETSEPYRAELTGDWVTACREWESLGTPYEAARALARIDDEASLRDALDRFERLGAEPMYALVIGRLRALGVSAIPRGRRSSTKMHPFGLTAREAEVLAQLEQGWTNGEIAARLFLSDRTVEHHVSAVLAKLGVKSRRDAVRLARERSLAGIEQTHLLAS
jgi:DNA-binding CsgD family transcriptional regulator